MSKALQFFGYNSLSVAGYTGFVVVKNGGKYSVSSTINESTKGTHSSLDDAKMVYKNGKEVIKGRIMTTNLSNIVFSWGGKYIAKAILGQKIISNSEQFRVEPAIKPNPVQSQFSFFESGKEKEVSVQYDDNISISGIFQG